MRRDRAQSESTPGLGGFVEVEPTRFGSCSTAIERREIEGLVLEQGSRGLVLEVECSSDRLDEVIYFVMTLLGGYYYPSRSAIEA